ncbi:hypothetical protein [Agriterribacter sp.]|uniref:baeRF3 domain-containing protein n=1 Tax=Agriterribacter sp. TaxID=2821509 RepID=UPI002B5B670E|nr:hypothetical protein [Agriterribacter sp.]HRO47205.1 hypothetical protein [Agriterribacter sp.]HRQ18437.1 hypothetical protein [Agriterribacter sp.]
MQINISTSIPAVHEKKRHWPAVSIIMPFEPVIQRKDDIMQQLRKAMKKVEWEMGTGYDEDLAGLVMLKLRTVIKNLNFSTFKKSIAIYVSPVFEKVMYLNMPVNETITVNEFFVIRDIVYAKKDIPAYFVLVLGEKWSTLYEGNIAGLIKIKSNGAGNIPGFKHAANMENVADDNAFFVKQFLQHTDEGLSIMLSAMPMPVLVTGKKNVLDYFKALTANSKSIVECIEGSHEKAAEGALFDIIHPYIADWDKIKIKHLYHQLEKAATEDQLVNGITAVQQSLSHHRGRLLVVGKSLIHNPGMPETDTLSPANPFNKFSCVRHVIDDVIEKVLENGGDVEMVDDDVLGGQQIALVKDRHNYM